MSYGDSYDAPKVYGLVAEFDSAEGLTEAADRARLAGYRKMDAYTPFPIHGLSDAIGFHDVRMPWMILCGGLLGGLAGYTMQWYILSIDYTMDVGGKPLNSIPSFVPITFEMTILFSALTAVFGMLALNRLPKPYHSIFNTPGFERATQDRFFLCIEADDKQYDSTATRSFLNELKPLAVNEVMA